MRQKPSDSYEAAVAGHAVYLRVHGSAGEGNCFCVRDFIEKMHRAGYGFFVVDLSDCTGMDSAFMGLLAAAAAFSRKDMRCGVTVVNAAPCLVRLLETMGLDKRISVESGHFEVPAVDFSPLLEQSSEEERRASARSVHKQLIEKTDEQDEAKFGPLIPALEDAMRRMPEDENPSSSECVEDTERFLESCDEVLPEENEIAACDPSGALSRTAMRHTLRRTLVHTMHKAGQEGSPFQPTAAVQCTLFAPRKVAPLDVFFLQAFLHRESQAFEAHADAIEFDEAAVRRGVRCLGCDIPVGTRVMFELSLPGILLEKRIEELTWRGSTESVQFAAQVPEGAAPQVVVGTVLISRDTVPLGHIKFKLTISAGRVAESAQAIGDEARHYTSAFVSYASEDRAQVLPRVQMLRAAGIRCFQDLLSLDPGARWEMELYRHIETSDLFLLFWSSAAKKSDWVKREALYALGLKAGDEGRPPEIRPVLIEGPPIPAPWAELQHLHFNDAVVYLVASEDRSRPVSD